MNERDQQGDSALSSVSQVPRLPHMSMPLPLPVSVSVRERERGLEGRKRVVCMREGI